MLNKKYSIHQLLEVFLLFSLPVICVGGASYFPYMLRGPLIYATGILTLAYIVLANIKLKFNTVTLLCTLFMSYFAISVMYSYHRSTTFTYLLLYACAFPLLFLDLSEDVSEKLINIFLIIAVVIACSIIISVPIKNCMEKYFWFIVNPNGSINNLRPIRKELAQGIYSGFAREKGEAAYIMNVGIAACLCNIFSNEKADKKNVIFMILLLCGLLLTGKRMMLLTVVLVFCLLFSLARMKAKAGKVVLISAGAFITFFVIMNFIPSLSTTFVRFADSENIESGGGREILWEYCIDMIRQYWLFGGGFGTYNEYAFNHGLTVNGHKWGYNAHNVYYQAWAEIGIVGSILLFGFLGLSFFRAARLCRNKQLDTLGKKIVYFSFYIQLMMLIYGISGNPIYTRQMIFMWVLSIAMVQPIFHKIYGNTVAGKKLRYR